MLTPEEATDAFNTMHGALPLMARWYAKRLRITYPECFGLLIRCLSGDTLSTWRFKEAIPYQQPRRITEHAKKIFNWPEELGRMPAYYRQLARFDMLLQYINQRGGLLGDGRTYPEPRPEEALNGKNPRN